jgi:anaerobic magnesium-protoporphyrin IX monomethyl ester cyclase
MKIAFIIPASPYLKDEKMMPPLGVLRLATFLESNNVESKIFNFAGNIDWESILTDSLSEFEYVGITALTPQLPNIIQICKFIRQNYPNIKIIIGGPHITLSYSSIQNGSNRSKLAFDYIYDLVDHIVIGYGEYALLKILTGELNDKIIDTDLNISTRLTNEKYEVLPFPERGLIDIDSYHFQIGNEKATSLISQLGCPYDCNFCGGRELKQYKIIRNRSAESIVTEIDYLVKTYGYKGFVFYDDEVNVNNKKFIILLEKLIQYQKDNKLTLAFRGSSRANLLSREQATLMLKAGFREVAIGFESGSNRMLNNMNKRMLVDQNTDAVMVARESGLKVKAYMSIGHPGESKETIEETRIWLTKVKPDTTDVTIITPYPGCNYFDKSVFDGKEWVYTSPETLDKLYSVDYDLINKSYFYKSKSLDYISYVHTDYLTEKDLVFYRNYLEKDYTKL